MSGLPWPAAPRLRVAAARYLSLEHVALVLLIVALLPIAFPFLRAGFPFGHDTGAHVTYTYRFDRAWAQGQIPVRWVEGFRAGDNQPLFNFYQVGFYYLVEAVHLAVPRLSNAFKLTVVMVWWLGAWFVFQLFKRCGVAGAVIASVLFALSPYLIVDGLLRSAYPELSAIAFVTGVLWSLDRWLTTGRTRYIPILSVMVALTLLCHLPTALMTGLMCGAHVLGLMWTRQTTLGRIGGLASATLLGAGLAAFYVLPALLELDLIQIQRMTVQGMDFHENFVPPAQWFRFAFGYAWSFGASVRDVDDLLPVHISAAHWAFLIAALVVVGFNVRRARTDWRIAALIQWLAITGFAMFMMTSSSNVVWEAIPAMSYIQYPWRFFMLLSISGGALGALLTSLVTSRRLQAALLILTVGLQVHLYHRRLRPKDTIPRAELNIDNPRWSKTPAGAKWGYYEPAYDPIGTERRLSGDVPRWETVGEGSRVESRAVADAWLSLVSSSEAGMTLRVNSHAFPGWSARVDGERTAIRRTEPEGYMEIGVPAGDHRIEIAFENTTVRALANTISAVSMAVLAIFSLRAGMKKWRKPARSGIE